MIKSKTVFVVGAGASNEVGLPTGFELRKLIAAKLDNRFDNFGLKLVSGDYQIVEAITKHVRLQTPKLIDINPYLFASWRIRDALPQALSIDNTLDAHTNDKEAQLCGKLGIIQSIREAEKGSKLFAESGQKINYTGIENTWYAQFFKLITENVQKKDLGTIFDNISFIIFNYDRCIEHYLINSLSNFYAISESESKSLLAKIKIFHPYGQIGSLLCEDNTKKVDFGSIKRMDILPLVEQIKTFTEQEIDVSTISDMQKLISESEMVVFLGFAFHELNMRLLSLKNEPKIKKVFATAKGISDDDCVIVDKDIRSAFKLTGQSIFLNNKLTCFDLFETYWRSLSR